MASSSAVRLLRRLPFLQGTAWHRRVGPEGCRRQLSSESGGSGPSAAGRSDGAVRLRLDTKVSPSGSADALFQECIGAIRQRRAELHQDPVFQNVETGAVTKLKQDELELTRKIFQRLDPSRDMTSVESHHAEHNIDPYWSPFHNVRDAREQTVAEFDEYARLVSVAEQKRVRIQIKKSLKRCAKEYNPYSAEFQRLHERSPSDAPPKPFRLPDHHWERTPLQERLGKEKITWRDVDIIQHFIADNGYILPRRTTTLSRQKQAKLVKAVKIAQRMALIPYNWKSPDYQAMALMDPLQWMADRLFDRVQEKRDRRSRMMLRVMMERHPDLNYRNFLRHEAQEAEANARRSPPAP